MQVVFIMEFLADYVKRLSDFPLGFGARECYWSEPLLESTWFLRLLGAKMLWYWRPSLALQWATAAIGMAVGSGLYIASIGGTALMLAILYLFAPARNSDE